MTETDGLRDVDDASRCVLKGFLSLEMFHQQHDSAGLRGKQQHNIRPRSMTQTAMKVSQV